MLLPLATASRANIFLTNLPWLYHEHGFLHVESVKSKLGLNCILEDISMQNMLVHLYYKRTKREMVKHTRTPAKAFRCLAFH